MISFVNFDIRDNPQQFSSFDNESREVILEGLETQHHGNQLYESKNPHIRPWSNLAIMQPMSMISAS